MIRITIEIDNEGVNITREDIGKKKAEKVLLEVKENPLKKSIITKKTKKCKTCGKPFKPDGNRQKYCSEKCGMKRKVYVKKREHKPKSEPEPESKSESITPTPTRLVIAKVEHNFIHRGNKYPVIEANKDSYLIRDDLDMEVWYDKSLFE
ncbi:MAG: hypothetical protein M0P71_12040 [Melioribacteraceae bacterium]|jgi:hypothetical protein|nr:hypothetical protein [Melioribacteraceae bacterium]